MIDREDYKEYFMSSIENLTEPAKRALYTKMLNDGIICEDDQISIIGMNAIQVSDFDSLAEKIYYATSLSKEAQKVVENWEFIKAYKYSVYFQIDELDIDNAFKQLLNNSLAFSNDTDESIVLSPNISKPIIFIEKPRYFLKFIIGKEYHDMITGAVNLRKYPILVVFHSEFGIIEIRYDALPSGYQNAATYYNVNISTLRTWITKNITENIRPLEMQTVIENITKPILKPEINIIARNYKFSNGGKADLYGDEDNPDYSLPFISDMYEMIQEYQDELEKAPRLRTAIINYLNEKENDSDSTWIIIVWKSERKANRISIKCTFGSNGHNYDQIMHYSNSLIDMGKMNYVAKYFADNIEHSESDES